MSNLKNRLDFTGKRVRLNGKVLTKFELASLADEIRPDYHWSICQDVLTYHELVDWILYLYCFTSGLIVSDVWNREYEIITK